MSAILPYAAELYKTAATMAQSPKRMQRETRTCKDMREGIKRPKYNLPFCPGMSIYTYRLYTLGACPILPLGSARLVSDRAPLCSRLSEEQSEGIQPPHEAPEARRQVRQISEQPERGPGGIRLR